MGHEATNHLFSLVIRIGRGTWIDITNRRVIYIREPQPAKQLTASGPLGTPQQMGVALQAKEWLEKSRRECISIPISTIMKCIKSKTTRIYSSDGIANYSAFIKPCRPELWDKLIIGTTTQSTVSLIDVKCPHCRSTFQLTPTKKPFKVKCPSCGKESMLR